MAKIKLTMACWNYDRTQALQDGRVEPEGIDLNYLDLLPGETFFRMLRHNEFDIAEMSLSSYVMTLFDNEPRFIAIPVFPSRVFRHSGIYINERSGIKNPQDLIGKRVGVPEYQITASVWIRGILSDDYGVKPQSVKYLQGGQESANRPEKLALSLPPEFDVQPIGPEQTLNDMLNNGEIDALYAARAPLAYKKTPGIRRLFENYKEVEQEYYSKTKIFPIMHTMVIRREIYDKYPWVAKSIFKAMDEAKTIAYEEFRKSAMLKYMLPWLHDHLNETREVMGEDFWPYGLQKNENVIETFLRYSHEQGLSKRLLKPEEIFAPETFESYTI